MKVYNYKIDDFFSPVSPLVLKTFNFKKQKTEKRIFILQTIVKHFEQDKKYTHLEITSILKNIYEDYATIRRALIDFGFMDRTDDLNEYWVKKIT